MSEWLRANLYSRTGFPDLLSPAEAAKISMIDEERLMQLARSGHAPCAVLDGSKYFFFKKDLMEWVKGNILRIQDGKRLGDDLKINVPIRAEFSNIPDVLRPLADQLKTLDVASRISCIYFLVLKNEVVYVGQSVSLPARIEQHRGTKEFDSVLYFQYPEYALDSLESAFIRHLKPKYNRSQVTSEMDGSHYRELEKISFLTADQFVDKKEIMDKALEGL